MSRSNLSTAGRCFVIIGLFSVLLLTQGQDDDWVDPFDMLNYDATTKTMRKPPDVSIRYSSSLQLILIFNSSTGCFYIRSGFLFRLIYLRSQNVIYDNVPTKRREYIQEPCPLPQCPDVSECNKKVEMLQRAVRTYARRLMLFK